jgi:hypothetical protein
MTCRMRMVGPSASRTGGNLANSATWGNRP